MVVFGQIGRGKSAFVKRWARLTGRSSCNSWLRRFLFRSAAASLGRFSVWPFPTLSDRLNWRGQHRGQQFGRGYAAEHLRCRGGSGRGANHQISGLCHIKTSFGQACDETNLPRIPGSPTTTENQRNVMNHLHTMSALGNLLPSNVVTDRSSPNSFSPRKRSGKAILRDPAVDGTTDGTTAVRSRTPEDPPSTAVALRTKLFDHGRLRTLPSQQSPTRVS